ncbi:ABC-F family ATP-binding cassette domain-containing protein [Cellulomonas carbonis]|uniref:Glycerophosphodiester phosphodiesterase n=1 Tax=Cellulomonas carbonis T26 TaxID=947969 RepID=A0A0A0BSY0_9CELL|nr:ABC-F family ATP-binding cassette domain-containing protein [Cellulomonas carbonis]KGM11066.1 glycerophosphodiester phosphodiesterase [Cellulomonas carbonis T26]GGC16414.1 ABC transporter ATP-binding protein [Cellulomonas carbonis]
MAHLLGMDSVSFTVGTRTLLEDVSIGVDDGMRVGVVGPNGAGKSTLLRLLARRQEPDSGRVTHAGGVRVGLLDQRDDLPAGTTVRDAVHGAVPDHTWARDARTRGVHEGLLGDLDLEADVARLSGGQRRRVALAGLLVADHDVLMLDEPTNHLDVEGVAWLAEHLADRYGGGRSAGQGALVVVTHDRWFLDAVCTRMWEVTGSRHGDTRGGTVLPYEGGYAAYVLARAERARQASVTAEKRDNLLRKELAWLRRGAPARTSKPRFRLDAAAALIADEPPPRDSLELARMATARLGKQVLDVEDVTVTVPVHGDVAEQDGAVPDGGPRERVLLDDVTWRLGPGDRFGLVGVNGAGKTTLLRLLTGEVTPRSGRVRRGKTVVVATLSQDVTELDELGDLRAVEVVERERRTTAVGGKEVTASQLVERLGFARERAQTLVRDLSGGERRRLQLLRLLVGEPNVLLLDEPTNDLDTDTLAAVEDLLDGWPGTLVVVSHDRYLLERVCDRQYALLGDGGVRDLPGGVEQYLELRRAARSAPAGGASSSAAPGGRAASAAPSAGPSATPDPADGAAPQPSQAEVRAARKEVARIERRLQRISEQEARVHAEMAAVATDHTAVQRLDADLRALAAEREQLEEEWLLAAEVAG